MEPIVRVFPPLLLQLLLIMMILTDVITPTHDNNNRFPRSSYKQNSVAGYYGFTNRRRCVERSLEAREASADAVFTGTIRHLEPDPARPDTSRATVELKRIIKGAHVLGRLMEQSRGKWTDDGVGGDGHLLLGVGGERRPTVMVEGIGDPSICNSEARRHDTWIFLVTKSPVTGLLRLNSSLVRISLDNIELAEAAVNDGKPQPVVIKGWHHYSGSSIPGWSSTTATTTAAQQHHHPHHHPTVDRYSKVEDETRDTQTITTTTSTTTTTTTMVPSTEEYKHEKAILATTAVPQARLTSTSPRHRQHQQHLTTAVTPVAAAMKKTTTMATRETTRRQMMIKKVTKPTVGDDGDTDNVEVTSASGVTVPEVTTSIVGAAVRPRHDHNPMTSQTTAAMMPEHVRAPIPADSRRNVASAAVTSRHDVTAAETTPGDDVASSTVFAVSSHAEIADRKRNEVLAVTSRHDAFPVTGTSSAKEHDSFVRSSVDVLTSYDDDDVAAVTSHYDASPSGISESTMMSKPLPKPEADRLMRGDADLVPCKLNDCLFGAQCFVNTSSFGTVCRCAAESCTDDDTVLVPVCGSDSVTYPSECSLRQASCTLQKPIAVRAYGSCEKFNKHVMFPGSSSTRPSHHHQQQQHDITTTTVPTHPADMDDVFDPCSRHRCGFGARCVPSVDGRTARCHCEARCGGDGGTAAADGGRGGPTGDELRSVCGDDGVDYSSECEMRRKACTEMRHINKKYDGKCDPCSGVECAAAQVCQLDDARRPVCRCGGTGADGVCPMLFAPVCASDGSTYANECVMTASACRQRRTDVRVLYSDECSAGDNPCSGSMCRGPGQLCNVEPDGAARCGCVPPCPAVMVPVCASDGKTYDSDCHVRRQSCLDQTPIVVVHPGVCNTSGPCARHVCHHGATCVARNGRPSCVCPMCSDDFHPVCGSDGVTYENECKLKLENCETRKNTTVLHKGLCDACASMKCEFYSNCETDEKGHGRCVCPTGCIKVENRVCGTDGLSYMNECELRIASCHRQQPIMIASRGACDLCVGVKCRYGARCDSGRCVCQYDCPMMTFDDGRTEPTSVVVCGSDGVTYVSECALRRAACTRGIELTVLHEGMCEETASGSGALTGVCDVSTCREYGGLCQTDKDGSSFCACNYSCEAVRSPVCGSDGRSYGSECQMREEGCKKQISIRMQPMEKCEDMDEELCDGNPVLINPRTGLEYNCNPGQDTCPAGSYCHKLVNVARCCREEQPIKSCVDTSYGCCPDGTTASLGPNDAGCPNVCDCNPLGSYGLTCDPMTKQCTCKPGVGGLHCDRCEPSYWGLPKISEGNSGCLPCNCNGLGSLREDCEQMTGRCVCRPGVTGQKCNICPNGKQLSKTGCTDVMLNDYLVQVRACSDRRCRFGAICQVTNGIPECVCPATCHENDVNVGSDSMLVCGSDSQTYGSACQLQLFACRLQKDISVAHYGPCSEGSTTLGPATVSSSIAAASAIKTTKSRRLPTTSKARFTKHLVVETTHITPAYGIIGDFCLNDADCYVTNSYCRSGLCMCRGILVPSDDNMMCIGEAGFVDNVDDLMIPSFTGTSYMQLKRLHHVNRDITIEMRFKPLRNDGVLLFTSQSIDGRGDFLSLALKSGFLEFRYDLGSGTALLKSLEKIQLNHFHRVMARRFGKDGVLRLDDGMEVSSTSPGMLRSLNLETPLYLGLIPNASAMVLRNVGVVTGFVGCIEHLEVNSSKTSLTFDLTHMNSLDIEHQANIRQCGKAQCSDMPCMHGGSCVEVNGSSNFVCHCADGFSGMLCENEIYFTTPCDPNPCEAGGSCIGLAEGGFVCKCPQDRDGDRCEKIDSALMTSSAMSPVPSISVPQFHGDSYMTIKLARSPSRSLSIEIWFLPFEPNGVLIYGTQEGTNKGDFISLNLVDERLQFRYNLGSGIANITSTSRVKMNEWNKVVVSRLNRHGMLTLNDMPPVKGQSGGILKELNMPQQLYIGGLKGSIYHPDSGVSVGFHGAIQRFYRDAMLVENWRHITVDQQHVTQYDGPPCPQQRNPCRHGARCLPQLNSFDCQCTEGYSGRLCQFSTSRNPRSVAFNGRTHHRYRNLITTEDRSQTTNRFEVRFRTEVKNGLLLLQHQSNNATGDYLAIALNDGHPEVSFNLGKERSTQLVILTSKVNVSEGAWHTLTFFRDNRIAQLSVDQEMPSVSGVSSPGADTLDTDGQLWIGGSTSLPRGLPEAYHNGFTGCIEYVRINDEPLDLDRHRNSFDIVSFCN